jgi:hypothetical protein
MSHSSTVLLVGGPDAGKSNFLFRLWIAIDGGTGAIVKNRLPDEVEYLRAGAESLLEGHFAAHTSEEVHECVTIPVKRAGDGRSGVLVVPDVPGEQILAAYRNRQWSKAWEDRISERCGCLIFIRADSSENVTPLDWVTCFQTYGGTLPVGGAASPPVAAPTAPPPPQVPPTQVVLTEWLQFLRRAFTDRAGGSFRPKVGIVVTAWDAVPRDQQDKAPLEYLRSNFPLLYQFVLTNDDRFEFELFAVSIAEGDLRNDEEFQREYVKKDPRQFGYVIHSLRGKPDKDKDLTLPVAWALNLWPQPAARNS